MPDIVPPTFWKPAGRKTSKTNANNEILKYTYNAGNDLLTLTDGKNQTTKWNYDQYGRVTNKVDQSNVEILRYKYEADNRLTENQQNTARTMPVGPAGKIRSPISHTRRFRPDTEPI